MREIDFSNQKTAMRYLFIFSMLIIFCSCNNDSIKSLNDDKNDSITSGSDKSETNEIASENKNDFESFLSNFVKTELPFIFKSYDFNMSDFTKFEGTKFKEIRGDRAFNSWWPYKQISVSEKFITVITVELNSINELVPILETYRPSGKIIDVKVLSFGWEEYTDYKDSVSINKDFSIYISGIVEKYEYDENREEIANTNISKFYYRDGKISDDGKIQLSKQMEQLKETDTE